jgi:hypothetical protein
MNYSATTYQFNNSTINKIYISYGWIITYNELEKKILTKPIEVNNSVLQTMNKFCIRDTKEELIKEIDNLELSEITYNENETIIDKAIKNISNYTSNE